MANTLEAVRNVWKIKDLRKKILFTLLMLLIYRVGSFIPIPGLRAEEFAALVQKGQLFGFLDIISGGAFQNASIFAIYQLIHYYAAFNHSNSRFREAAEGRKRRKKEDTAVRPLRSSAAGILPGFHAIYRHEKSRLRRWIRNFLFYRHINVYGGNGNFDVVR
jgi:hypothetical protein